MLTEALMGGSESASTYARKRRRRPTSLKMLVYYGLVLEGEDKPYSHKEAFPRRESWASLVGRGETMNSVEAKTAPAESISLPMNRPSKVRTRSSRLPTALGGILSSAS